MERQHEVDINKVNSETEEEKDAPSNGENNVEDGVPGTGGYIIRERDLEEGITSTPCKGNKESAEIKSTRKETKGGGENHRLHSSSASCGSDAHEQVQVKCNQGDTQLDEAEIHIGQKKEKELQCGGEECHKQEKENRDISEGQLNGAGQCAEGALLEMETMHSLRDSEKKGEERKKKNKKKKEGSTKRESKRSKRGKAKEKGKEAEEEKDKEAEEEKDKAAEEEKDKAAEEEKDKTIEAETDKTTEADNESEQAKEKSTEKNEELLVAATGERVPSEGEVQESVEYATDSIARIISKEESDSNRGETPRGGSLHKMCPSNGVKHLETYESKVCVANSFHDISSPTSENEEIQEGNYKGETGSYGENRKSFDLLSYIENGIKNYVHMLKEENVEIYERKCVKEMISFHKLKLKYLKKKKKLSKIYTWRTPHQIADEGSVSSDTTHNKGTNKKSENENADMGKKSSKSKNRCSKQKRWGRENDQLGTTPSVHVKRKETKKMKRRGANKSSDESSPGKMDTSSSKDMGVESQLEELGCAESSRREWVPPSNGAEVKRECQNATLQSKSLSTLQSKSLSTLQSKSLSTLQSKSLSTLQNKCLATLQNKCLASPNEDLERGEIPSSKNVFEALFHFYAKDKGNTKRNIEPEGKTSEVNCYTKGMDLELFLNFAKHYKIIKSLLTKSELEKIFLNESKGNEYIQGRQFQKVLMVCAQIAFTKPPHRVNFTDTKKIFQCLVTWLCNNAPEQQKKIILKSCQLADASMLTENGKTAESKKADVKSSSLRNKQYSISVKDKSKKTPINNIVLTNSQKFETPSKKLEKAKIFRYNTSINLRK
ncbi:hypothetical protein PCYB_124740 [Plasmodium cynomolgi strain B]|uniref:Uncharacterized protein n=1 Tax=Plasmodium cynomolgi (strain B) TaxID=1120755 RepID=K6ULQ0_PLACD|nr:hypothetical protein PCYB_124740 [Plasmodium cynomolgi strain B]GAB67908.1 hypothetical protein PCYB_124740 [Plasmodium cynomolgi strain B]